MFLMSSAWTTVQVLYDVTDPVYDQAEAAELIREKVLLATRQEVPHSVAVSVDKWDDRGKVAATMRDFSYPAAMVSGAVCVCPA